MKDKHSYETPIHLHEEVYRIEFMDGGLIEPQQLLDFVHDMALGDADYAEVFISVDFSGKRKLSLIARRVPSEKELCERAINHLEEQLEKEREKLKNL